MPAPSRRGLAATIHPHRAFLARVSEGRAATRCSREFRGVLDALLARVARARVARFGSAKRCSRGESARVARASFGGSRRVARAGSGTRGSRGARRVARAGARRVARAGARRVARAGARRVARAGARRVARAELRRLLARRDVARAEFRGSCDERCFRAGECDAIARVRVSQKSASCCAADGRGARLRLRLGRRGSPRTPLRGSSSSGSAGAGALASAPRRCVHRGLRDRLRSMATVRRAGARGRGVRR